MLFSHSPVALTFLRPFGSKRAKLERRYPRPIKGAGYDSLNDSLNDCVIVSPFYLLKGPGPFRRLLASLVEECFREFIRADC